jgi:hypothetical protein
MEELNENVVNATSNEGVVDSQPTEQIETTEKPVDAGNEEVTPSPVEEKVQQTPEQNAVFADVRRKASSEAQDNVIKEMNLSWNDKPITTYSDYQRALQEQKYQKEAEEKGVDPELYSQVNTMQNELSSLRRDKTLMEQDTQLSNDPKMGEIYKEYREDIHKMANEYNVDYDTALTILTRDKFAELMSKHSIKAEQDTIKGLQQNAQTSPGAIGQSGVHGKTSIAQMDKKSFRELTESVLRGETNKF